MTRIGVVRHSAPDFAAWRKFDERMAVRKANGWTGHELYITMRPNRRLMWSIRWGTTSWIWPEKHV